MGISVQAAGIGVQSDKHYLVNLNADPAMNELLVCYLKVGGRVCGGAGWGICVYIYVCVSPIIHMCIRMYVAPTYVHMYVQWSPSLWTPLKSGDLHNVDTFKCPND